MIPMIGRMTLDAGTDCQRPNESVPVRHRIVPGITSVTMPGSKMMARRCFHIRLARPSKPRDDRVTWQCLPPTQVVPAEGRTHAMVNRDKQTSMEVTHGFAFSSPTSPVDRSQPRLGSTRRERQCNGVIGSLEPCFPDLDDFPAITEGVADLLLGDPPWSLSGRLLVAEAEDVDTASGTDDLRETRLVDRSLFVGKCVEQPAVDHRVECATQLIEL